MSTETVTVPAWKLRRAAEILDRDGDEHGVAADLWSMLADAGCAEHALRPCGALCAGKVRDGLECSPGRCAVREAWVDPDSGEQRVTPRPAAHKKPPPHAV